MTNPPSQAEPYDYAANCRTWPAVDGPFPIGTIDFEVTDPTRGSQYAPTPSPTRRLYARAWYPAAETTGRTRRPYFTEAEATVLPAPLMTLFQQPADALREGARLLTNAYLDAPPASGPFPVLGFNHGFTSYPSQQTALFEHLAANGYVVVTVGHPYESGGIVYPNGDAANMAPAILDDLQKFAVGVGVKAYAAPTIAEQLAALREQIQFLRNTSLGRLAPVWRDDVYFVLDRLEEAAIPAAGALSAILDHDRRGYLGMSYGGYIAGMLAQGDPRARAVVHLDGGFWTYDLVDTNLRTPFVTIGADLRSMMLKMPDPPAAFTDPLSPRTPAAQDLAYERLTEAGLRADGYRFVIPGLQHVAVSDLPELGGVPTMRAGLGDEETLVRFTKIQNDLVGGFLDRHLKGLTNDYPASALSRHPTVLAQDLSWLRERARSRNGR